LKKFILNIKLNKETILFILPFLFIGIVGVAIGVHKNQLARKSFKWPKVQGQVLRAEISTKHSRGHSTPGEGHANSRTSYQLVVEYQFSVNKQSYKSKQISFGENSYNTRVEATALLQEYDVGKEVAVYYQPGNPENSVIKLVNPNPLRPYLIVGMGFCLVSLLYIGIGVLNTIKQKKKV
jgi:hypothetical protein